MRRCHSYAKPGFISFCIIVSSVYLLCDAIPTRALTESHGQPYHGRLINGIPFPPQFQGYQIREEDRTHTTPEVIGAVLDAIDNVQKHYPGTANLYIGDFTSRDGGFMNRHRSHQNGRDVDLGMYAKGNRPLDTFIGMNEENLDVSRTWCLIEGLLRSQRVQYIFLDKRIQKLLYDYAVAQGNDVNYLDRLFGNGRGAIIQHVVNHHDHMHVRFFTPWSTLAAHISESDTQKRTLIEMAQQAYLPKKVYYYAKGNESNLDTLARSFGVTKKELCRWNQLHPNDIPSPGSCLVFYKRGFEIEPVHLAESIQPGTVPETPSIRLASLRPQKSLSDVPLPVGESTVKEKKSDTAAPLQTYTTKRGDTLAKIAKRNSLDVKTLADLNGMKKGASLRAGQTIKLSGLRPDTAPVNVSVSDGGRTATSKYAQTLAAAAPSQQTTPTVTSYIVGKDDTLPKIAKQKGIDVETLCLMNGLKKQCNLKPGQRIVLARVEPSSGKNQSKTSSATNDKATSKKTAGTASKAADNAAQAKKAAKTAPLTTPVPSKSSALNSKPVKMASAEPSSAKPRAGSAVPSKPALIQPSNTGTSAKKPATSVPQTAKSPASQPREASAMKQASIAKAGEKQDAKTASKQQAASSGKNGPNTSKDAKTPKKATN